MRPGGAPTRIYSRVDSPGWHSAASRPVSAIEAKDATAAVNAEVAEHNAAID